MNTYTGTTNQSSGSTIKIGSKSAFGTSTLKFSSSSGNIQASADLTSANKINNNIIWGANETINNSGTFGIEFGGTVDLNGAGRTINSSISGGVTFDGVISNDGGNGLTIVTTNSSLVTLKGTNTYSGNTTFSGTGKLSVSSIGDSGANGNVGSGGTINLGSSTSSGFLVYTGTGENTSKIINLAGTTGGATIDQSGTGLLKFTTVSFDATGAGTKTLTLQGSTSGSGEVASNIINNGSTALTKAGTGTWTLSATNNYKGVTTINGGTLLITGSTAPESTVAVNNTATLGGSGTILGPSVTVANGGTVAPGSSPGVLNIGNSSNASSISFATGSTFAVEIGGTTAGNASNNHDQLNVSGTVSLGSATLSVTTVNGFVPSAGQTFTIINNDSTDAITGTFSSLSEGAIISNFLGSGLNAKISYAGGSGNDVVLTVLAPPTVTSVSPTSGSPLGGFTLTINGTNFAGATAVTVGGSACTSVTNSGTQITCTAPAHAAGAVSVEVTTPGGTNSANTLFTYVNPPSVPSITGSTPTSPANNTAPTINGTADAGNTVKLYTASDCSGGVAGMGTATGGSFGIGVTVGNNSTTTFYATATDSFSNVSACSSGFSYTSDSISPSLSYTPLANTTSTSAIPLAVTSSDSVAMGTVSVFYKINGGSFTSSGCTAGTPPAWTCTIPGQSSGTAVSYYVAATDAAGNTRNLPVNNSSFPNLYTVGAATIPAGNYTYLSLGDGTTLGGDILTAGLDLGGIVTTGANTLELGCGTVTGAGGSSYVVGNFKNNFCSAGTFVFPVGTTADGSRPSNGPGGGGQRPASPPEYTPLTMTVNSGSFPAVLTVSVTDAILTGLDPSKSVTRSWNVALNFGSVNADMTFAYLDQDVNGTETNYKVFKNASNATTEVTPNSVNAGANTATVTGVSSFSGWGIGLLSPTAASVSLSGRVVTADGRGVPGALVTVSGNGLGMPITVRSGPSGRYVIRDLEAGQTYIVSISSKRFRFRVPDRLVSLGDDLTGFDFVAIP